METNLRTIKDGHFCWADNRILNLIVGYFKKSPKKKRTARSVYLALAEISSFNKDQSEFNCSRSFMAYKAIVSPTTLDRYLASFIKIGILKKINRKSISGKENLVNRWSLLSYPSIRYLGYALRDDKSHCGYNKREMFLHNQGEDINKHIKEEREIGITNAPNVPLKGYLQNTSNKSLKGIQNGANGAFLAPANVTNVTDKEGQI